MRGRTSGPRLRFAPSSWISSQLLAQIGVVAAAPVIPGRRENIHGDGIFERHDVVRRIRGNVENIARLEHHFAPAQMETQFPLLKHGDLLVDMRVFRDDASLGEMDARDRQFVAMDHLAREKGI